jgi:hypothetical protein
MRSLYVLARPSTPDEARQTAFALTLERRGPGTMPHSEIVFIVEQAKRARREAKRPRLASPAANPRPLDPPALFPPPPPDDPDRSALVEARRLLGTFRRDFRHRFGAARTLTALCDRIDGLAISGQMEIAQVLGQDDWNQRHREQRFAPNDGRNRCGPPQSHWRRQLRPSGRPSEAAGTR